MEKLAPKETIIEHENKETKTMRILSYWHLIEFFVPFDLEYVKQRTKSYYLPISKFQLSSDYANDDLPWLSPEAKKRSGAAHEKDYIYYLYILPFNKNEAKRISQHVFPFDKSNIETIDLEERLEDEGETCFAKLMVSHEGIANFSQISVSTLPWAMGKLIQKDLDCLSAKHYDEEEIKLRIALNELDKHINLSDSDIIADNNNSPGILSAQGLNVLLKTLRSWAQFDPEHPLGILVEMREYKVATSTKNLENSPLKQITHQNKRQQDADIDNAIIVDNKTQQPADQEELVEIDIEDDVDILNSFFIEDIEKIMNSLKHSHHDILMRYIHGTERSNRKDLYTTEYQNEIINSLKPDLMTEGRWPNAPTHNMSLMQQYAINKCFSSIDASPIFSVNGPPGTGKTTLLQDIIANNVVKRAHVLSDLPTVASAFNKKKSIAFEDHTHYTINCLIPELTGYEMLVVSSNNAAVENISKTLPLKMKLAKEYQERCQYFSPVASKIWARHTKDAVKPLSDHEKPWGLISIALGNRANRYKIASTAFYGPEQKGKSGNRVKEGKYLTIWEFKKNYNGPTFSQAKSNFKQAYNTMRDYLKKVKSFEKLHDEFKNSTFKAWHKIEIDKKLSLEKTLANTEKQLKNQEEAEVQLKNDKEIHHNDENETKSQKPSWFARLFRLSTAKQYVDSKIKLQQRWNNLLNSTEKHRQKREKIVDKLTDLKEQILEVTLRIEKKQVEYTKLQTHYQETMKKLDGITLPPNDNNLEYFSVQLSSFWQTESLNRLRSELFICALALHEAWLIEALNKKLFIGNLLAVSDFLHNRKLTQPDNEIDIWQSLFLWIPVVSSTFASIAQQFKNVDKQQLGWLLIDEAGQAIPHAALGALWRTQKAVIVGDPRQIEPVFTIPANLVEGLAEQVLTEDPDPSWLPTQSSVQLLADNANCYGAHVKINEQTQWIGAPLRVHRRCVEPMFSVSNRISYENKMLNARQPLHNGAKHFLGDSAWFHLKGDVTDKQYVQTQGKFLARLFTELYRHENGLPELYIITPFKRIKQSLRTLLRDADNWTTTLESGTPLPKPHQLQYWCRKHIGTVHTFQGKESDTVIFILGADQTTIGSIAWASSKANLLNVALTRARDNVYVIGDYDLWSKRAYFSDFAQSVEKKEAEILLQTFLNGSF